MYARPATARVRRDALDDVVGHARAEAMPLVTGLEGCVRRGVVEFELTLARLRVPESV